MIFELTYSWNLVTYDMEKKSPKFDCLNLDSSLNIIDLDIYIPSVLNYTPTGVSSFMIITN